MANSETKLVGTAFMVKTLARRDAAALDKYVPAIEKEYAFWMDGAASLKMDGQANRRAVKMGSALLNRYWDDNPIPRQEAWKEDIKTAESSARAPQEVYRNIRAAAESGMPVVNKKRQIGIAVVGLKPVIGMQNFKQDKKN